MLGSRHGLQWLRPDAHGRAVPLVRSDTVQIPWWFSPNGRYLAYHALSPTTGFDLWTVPITETAAAPVAGEPAPFLRTAAYETYPAFSPDGRWIAYGSGAYGRWDVFVRAFPDNGAGEVRVSDSGGRIPFWLPNGHQLLYRTDDQHLRVVEFQAAGGSFVVAKSRPWAEQALADTGVISNLDLDRQTGRVVVLLPAGVEHAQSPNHVTVRLNTGPEIRGLVFGGRN
ncbi:MAG: hypothetical protein ABI211_25265 [Vicinamibacterales bacterium]